MYPIHSPELDEDDDDKPLVRSDRAADSEDEDDNPLAQPSSRKEPVKEKRESATELLQRYEEEKDLQSGEIHRPHWTKMSQETRVSDQKKSRFGAKIQMVKLSARPSKNFWMKEI